MEVGQNQIRVEDRDELGSKVVAQTRDAGASSSMGAGEKVEMKMNGLIQEIFM